MSVAGIDFSSRFVDVVLLDEDTDAATWHRFPLLGQDAFARARDVHRAFNFPSDIWESIVAVGIEDPRGYGSGSLYRVQGAILAGLPWQTLVQPWIPSAWRKTVGLPGNASKQDVMQYVRARHFGGVLVTTEPSENPGMARMTLWNSDSCDAYCIALATRTVLQRTEAA